MIRIDAFGGESLECFLEETTDGRHRVLNLPMMHKDDHEVLDTWEIHEDE